MQIQYITILMMTVTATVYMLCAMVMWLGGWLRAGQEYHSTKLQKYISVTNAICAVSIFLYILERGRGEEISDMWIYLMDWLCNVPLALLNIQSVLLCQKDPKWKDWMIAFWPLAVGLVIILFFGGTFPVSPLWQFYLTFVYQLVLYAYGIYRLRKWDSQIREEFSNIAHKQTIWFRHLTIPFILLTLLWIPMSFYPETTVFEFIYYIINTAIAIAMSSHALAHEEFDFDASVLLATSDKDVLNANTLIADEAIADEGLVASEHPAWVEKLEKAMHEQHLYRQPDLTLTTLAEEIGVNRTYLSNYINKTMNSTFYDYIASYRTEEAKSLLTDTNRPLSEIANMCGFTSPATFSRCFKKNVGNTPTEYRNSNVPAFQSDQNPRQTSHLLV